MYFSQKKTKKEFRSTNVSRKTLHKHLEFTALEQYKLLRTNLDFTLPQDESCPIIGVTSSMRGEGKSTTAINLAYVIAEKGKRVLLIDGDLRIPSIAKKMGISSTPGLTDLLMGKGAQVRDFRSNVLENLFIIPSGEIPPNPSELLGSQRMKSILLDLKGNFDYIIIPYFNANLKVISEKSSLFSHGIFRHNLGTLYIYVPNSQKSLFTLTCRTVVFLRLVSTGKHHTELFFNVTRVST